ncbi:MAG: Do family serine endopeptidase [Bacteroidota bacterium]
MKKISLLIVAAVMGSALTIGGYHLFDMNGGKTIKIEHISGTPVVDAGYAVNEKGERVHINFTEVAEKVMPAVVHIKSTRLQSTQPGRYRRELPDPFRDFFKDDWFRHFFGPPFEIPEPEQHGPQPRVGSGSGVIISEEGYIVTNNHVIENSDDIEVTLNDNRVFKARVVGIDPTTDIGLVQIKADDLTTIPLANSDEIKVGEWVLAVGNPFNLNSTVTAGIISAKARNINIFQDRSAIESFLQTDAAINPGNSGGALVNLQGGLVGINTAIASPTGAYAGYGFAVPSNLVDKVVQDLLRYGTVQRGFLGVLIRGVDGNLAREKDLEVTQGVYVDSLMENSAAGDAGIKPGDVILEVNGQSVKSSGKLLEIIGQKRPGDKVTLLVNRFGEKMEFEVTLRNQEGETRMVEKEEKAILDILGVNVEKIDRKTARKLDIPGGVKITRLYPGKLKSQTDIREGFIITKVNEQEVTNVDDFVELLEDKKGGVMLEGVYEDYPGTYYYAFGL